MQKNLYSIIVVFLPFLLLALAFGFVLSLSENFLTSSGHFIGSSDIGSDYVRGVVWAFALSIVLILLPFPKEIHKIILWLWLARCIVTLGFMLIYEDNYNLDAYHYFHNSISLLSPSVPKIGDGTQFISWLAWKVNAFTPFSDSYHTLKVFWSFLGLIGVYVYYKIFLLFQKEHHPKILLLFGLFPSVLFWSSILGKDPIVFLGIALAVYGSLSCLLKFKFSSLLWALIGFFLISMVRIWLGGIVVGCLVVATVLQGRTLTFKKGVLTVGMVILVTVLAGYTMQRWNLTGLENTVAQADQFSKSWGRGGSAQVAPQFSSIKDMAVFAPIGMFTAVFRPLPGEVPNAFGWMAGLENIFLIVIFTFSMMKLQVTHLKNPLLIFILSYIFVWSFLYGFVSYQNLGTAFRFKLQILPFLLILPMYLKMVSKKTEPLS